MTINYHLTNINNDLNNHRRTPEEVYEYLVKKRLDKCLYAYECSLNSNINNILTKKLTTIIKRI